MNKGADLTFKVLNFATWAFLIFTGFYDLSIFPARSLIWFGSFIVLSILYFKLKQVPKYAHFLLALIVLFNLFGELFFQLFYTFGLYDKILHFLDPIFICVFVYHLTKSRFREKHMLAIFAVCVTISFGAVWEIIEYLFDGAFGGLMQGVYQQTGEHFFGANGEVQSRLDDTMVDLILDVCGAVVFWFIYIFFHNKKMFNHKK